jgi:hypothetical protein
MAAYNYAYYGLPLGYVYTSPAPMIASPAPMIEPSLQCQRGEYRVGNCLMICQ